MKELFTKVMSRDYHQQKSFYEDDFILPKKSSRQKANFVIPIKDEEISTLLNRAVNHRNILGYQSLDTQNNILNIKYDKDSELYLVYDKEKTILQSCRKSWRDFNAEKVVNYYDELIEKFS